MIFSIGVYEHKHIRANVVEPWTLPCSAYKELVRGHTKYVCFIYFFLISLVYHVVRINLGLDQGQWPNVSIYTRYCCFSNRNLNSYNLTKRERFLNFFLTNEICFFECAIFFPYIIYCRGIKVETTREDVERLETIKHICRRMV